MSPLELAWTVVALVGTVVAFALMGYIWLSYAAIEEWIRRGWAVRWGPRHKFALGFLVGSGLLGVVWLGFVALGVNAMLNPPLLTPDRAEASTRGGIILVGLESVLLGFQFVLTWAWVAIGRPSLGRGAPVPTLADLLEAATVAGREMGHLIANDLQQPISLLEEVAADPDAAPSHRADAALAVRNLLAVMERVRALHAEIKRLGGVG